MCYYKYTDLCGHGLVVQLSLSFDIVFTIQHFCLYTGRLELPPEDYIRVGDYSVVASADPELAVDGQDEGGDVQKSPSP